MKYSDFLTRTSFSKEELLALAWGNLVEDGPTDGFPMLPAPPFLMFDRVTAITRSGGKGTLVAEQDIHPDAWYFQCHFRNDPVQPGSLGVDALWQLLGIFCAVSGATGSGRALGCKEIEFLGQIRPYDKIVRYELDVRRFALLPDSGVAIAVANGRVFVDDVCIYSVAAAKVGVFRDIAYREYPNPLAKFSRGGILNRGS